MAVGIGIIAYLARDVREIIGLKRKHRIVHKLQSSGIKIDVTSILFYIFFVLILLVCMFVLWYFLKV